MQLKATNIIDVPVIQMKLSTTFSRIGIAVLCSVCAYSGGKAVLRPNTPVCVDGHTFTHENLTELADFIVMDASSCTCSVRAV